MRTESADFIHTSVSMNPVLEIGVGLWGSGFRVRGSGFGVWGLGFGVWGLGVGVERSG